MRHVANGSGQPTPKLAVVASTASSCSNVAVDMSAERPRLNLPLKLPLKLFPRQNQNNRITKAPGSYLYKKQHDINEKQKQTVKTSPF